MGPARTLQLGSRAARGAVKTEEGGEREEVVGGELSIDMGKQVGGPIKFAGGDIVAASAGDVI